MMDDDDDDVVPGSYREQQLPGGAGVFKTWLTCARQEQGEQQVADRELLEMAAKAAGIKLFEFAKRFYLRPVDHRYASVDWNPLKDDGDALRLAVKLRIDLIWFHLDQEVRAVSEVWSDVKADAREPYGDDRGAATRRAIVRAAAEVGRKM